MKRFEGLNLPDLMELMHELAMPEVVSMVPKTSGWWVAIAWILAMMTIFGWQLHKRRQRNRYRREAVFLLRKIAARAEDNPADAAVQIAVLLKRTALAAYPRDKVAPLHGPDWANFLRESANHDSSVNDAADELASAAYRTGVDGRLLVAPARKWIQLHRA